MRWGVGAVRVWNCWGVMEAHDHLWWSGVSHLPLHYAPVDRRSSWIDLFSGMCEEKNYSYPFLTRSFPQHSNILRNHIFLFSWRCDMFHHVVCNKSSKVLLSELNYRGKKRCFFTICYSLTCTWKLHCLRLTRDWPCLVRLKEKSFTKRPSQMLSDSEAGVFLFIPDNLRD